MKIIYYKSVACPRCLPVTKVLEEMSAQDERIEIDAIEVLAHPAQAWKAGVRRIPTLQIGDESKSWFAPDQAAVRAFIQEHLDG